MASKVNQLREALSSHILAGEYQPGDRLPSTRQLASEHEVSVLTAGLALKELQERRLIDIRRGSGAYVTYDASKRSATRKLTIGLAYLDVYQQIGAQSGGNHPAVLQWLQGLQDHFVLEDLSTKSILYRRGELLMSDAIDQQSIDGLLVTGPISAEEVDRIRDRGVPVVLLQHRVKDREVPSVMIDGLGGLHRLAERLRLLGHERLAMITYQAGQSFDRPRQIAYAAAIRSGGLRDFAPDDLYVVDNETTAPTRAAYREQAERVLDAEPTAVITSDETMASHVISLCYERGWKIPDDLSLMTLDDMSPKSHPIELTRTNSFDVVRDASRFAAALLDRLIGGDEAAKSEVIVVPTTIVEGESVAPPKKRAKQKWVGKLDR